MGDTEIIIVFGRFLLDCVPIKLDESWMEEEGKCWWRRCRKGKERRRLLHYRDQLPGSVSCGICRIECHVALLHWDSVLRKRGIIKERESEGKKAENQKERGEER